MAGYCWKFLEMSKNGLEIPGNYWKLLVMAENGGK